MTHVVNKLLVEVTCPDEERAFRLRHGVSVMLQDEVLELIDRVCNKYGEKDDWIFIDKLEIDMGRMSSWSFGSNFPNFFAEGFERELAQKIKLIPVEKKEQQKLDSRI